MKNMRTPQQQQQLGNGNENSPAENWDLTLSPPLEQQQQQQLKPSLGLAHTNQIRRPERAPRGTTTRVGCIRHAHIALLHTLGFPRARAPALINFPRISAPAWTGHLSRILSRATVKPRYIYVYIYVLCFSRAREALSARTAATCTRTTHAMCRRGEKK